MDASLRFWRSSEHPLRVSGVQILSGFGDLPVANDQEDLRRGLVVAAIRELDADFNFSRDAIGFRRHFLHACGAVTRCTGEEPAPIATHPVLVERSKALYRPPHIISEQAKRILYIAASKSCEEITHHRLVRFEVHLMPCS